MVPLSNITVDGRTVGGLGNSEANWHSDMTYEETPPPASVLLGVEEWKVGDVIIWDNCRVRHRRNAFPNHMRRMMRRCQVLARET